MGHAGREEVSRDVRFLIISNHKMSICRNCPETTSVFLNAWIGLDLICALKEKALLHKGGVRAFERQKGGEGEWKGRRRSRRGSINPFTLPVLNREAVLPCAAHHTHNVLN